MCNGINSFIIFKRKEIEMKKLAFLALILFTALTLSASFSAAESDRYFYNENDYQKDYDYLLKCLSESTDSGEKAEILWRLSRTKLTLVDENKDNMTKSEKLAGYGDYGANDKPSEEDTSSAFYYAYTSLLLKETPNGYHWKSSAVGRCGQVHGALNSLGKAGGMRDLEIKALENFSSFPLETDSWYVMGVLYNSLPGGISFGNDNWAISYMRKCLDTQDMTNRTNGTNYLELARQLWDRNWNSSKRTKEFQSMLKSYNKAVDKKCGRAEINRYYEGYKSTQGSPFYVAAELTSISDRQEAVALLQYAKLVIESRLPYASGSLSRAKMEAEKAKIEAALSEWI